jgi:hypothetical protein
MVMSIVMNTYSYNFLKISNVVVVRITERLIFIRWYKFPQLDKINFPVSTLYPLTFWLILVIKFRTAKFFS